MSNENFEVVLAGFRCFEAWDLDGFRRLLGADVTATAFEDWPEPGPWTDPDDLIHQLEPISADWSNHRIADPQLAAEEGEWVIVQYRWEVEGATRGIEMGLDLVGAFRGSERTDGRTALAAEPRAGPRSRWAARVGTPAEPRRVTCAERWLCDAVHR